MTAALVIGAVLAVLAVAFVARPFLRDSQAVDDRLAERQTVFNFAGLGDRCNEVAIDAPSAVRPTFTHTTGTPACAAWSAASCNVRPSLNPSMYAAMAPVSGWSANHCTKSANSRSTSLPVGAHALSPMPSSWAWNTGRP